MSENSGKCITVYTTATAINDVRGTTTLNPKAGITSTGRPVRQVSIPEGLYLVQMKQYVSGLFTVMDEQEWKIEQQFGNVTAFEEMQSA